MKMETRSLADYGRLTPSARRPNITLKAFQRILRLFIAKYRPQHVDKREFLEKMTPYHSNSLTESTNFSSSAISLITKDTSPSEGLKFPIQSPLPKKICKTGALPNPILLIIRCRVKSHSISCPILLLETPCPLVRPSHNFYHI